MSERPLLLFPIPETASRSTLSGGGGQVRTPPYQQQCERLFPIFAQLQASFDARRLEIQQNAIGINPEQVLVIEIVGSIDNFANAIKRIDGLEWMGEIELNEILPDEEFYDETRPDKDLNGRLYLIMTNQQALEQILTLWRRYSTDQNVQFERGLSKFRYMFLHLKTIRRWNVQDRLLETGVIDKWREGLEHWSDRVVSFEVELWFRHSHKLREESTLHVKQLIEQVGGKILCQSIIEGIEYHCILAELPVSEIQNIVENQNTELVKCEDIMFFRAVGQIMVGNQLPEGEIVVSEYEEQPLPTGEPIVALLDGAPLTNHHLLAGRLIIDDPDNWEEDYAANERVHGTSMASLIIHGDLNQPSTPLSRPLYIRPIMKPCGWTSPRIEYIPIDCLLVDLIHRAVKRLFEIEQEEGPVAPQIKIINLSIGDPDRLFTQSMSPIAKLLDWLSFKYKVLFIVSAGNHLSPISLKISRSQFELFEAEELEAATIKALYQDARHRRLLAPAETINGLTVGSIHYDESPSNNQSNLINLFQQPLPSPFTAFGSGYRRAIKPDMVFGGGKGWYRLNNELLSPNDLVILEPAFYRSGNKVACPSPFPGEINASSHSHGTSNATALISRAASICYESMLQIFSEYGADVDLKNSEIPLLKAMLTHGCSWGEMGSYLKSQIENSDLGKEIKERAEALYSRQADISNEISRQYKTLLSRWMGYGTPQIERLLDCTPQRATILGYGELTDGEAHVFRLPLPPSLSARQDLRRLTVTLAWISPILAGTQKYRSASLWFEIINDEIAPSRKNADWLAVRRGTVQHEIFEGERAEPFLDNHFIEIKVNCRKDAGDFLGAIGYGLVVSLEVSEGIEIDIYNEIRTRILPAIQIQN